jgi:hypothetical protein
MSILFHDNAYFAGMWYLYADATKPLEDQFDWLAALWRDVAPDSPWVLQSRMRRYCDPLTFKSADQKTWWEAVLPGTATETVAQRQAHTMATTLQKATRTRLQYIALRCDGDTAIQRLMKMDLEWFHIGSTPEGPR